MKKIFILLALILPTLVIGQVTIRRSVIASNSTQLDGKGAAFYVDTLNNQNIGGLKVFKDDLVLDSTLSIGVSTPDGSAILDITSTTKGFLMPRMTTTERDNISTPASGLFIYNSTTNRHNMFHAPDWKQAVVTSAATLTVGSVPFTIADAEIDDDNDNFFWDNTNKRLGIGTSTPNATLDVTGTPGASIGGFPSGQFHITNPSTSEFANSVITFHNLFNVNTQTAYIGSTSGSNYNFGIINRQVGNLTFHTTNIVRVTIEDDGDVVFENQIRIKGGTPGVDKVLTSDAVGIATWETLGGGDIEGMYSGLNSQTPTTTTPIVLTFESEDITEKGITHSTTVNPGEFTATIAKTYTWQIGPQWQKTTAAGTDTLDFFVELDTGGGFVKIANSNIKVIIDEVASDVIFLSASIPMNVGDKVRFMFRSSNPPNLQTTFFAATSDVPATPSQILNVFSGN